MYIAYINSVDPLVYTWKNGIPGFNLEQHQLDLAWPECVDDLWKTKSYFQMAERKQLEIIEHGLSYFKDIYLSFQNP